MTKEPQIPKFLIRKGPFKPWPVLERKITLPKSMTEYISKSEKRNDDMDRDKFIKEWFGLSGPENGMTFKKLRQVISDDTSDKQIRDSIRRLKKANVISNHGHTYYLL